MPPKSKPKSQNITTDNGGDEYISLSTVKELMSQHENAFKVMIDSLIKSTTSRVDGFVKDLAELKYSLKYSQKDIASQQIELDRNQSEIQSMSNEISNIKMSLDKYSTKTVDLENRSRRNNIRVTGIPEKRSETWDDSEAMVKSVLKEKLGLASEPRIERAHRVGYSTKQDGSPRNAPRPIVCRLYDWKEKEHVLKQARIHKPSGIYVNDDVAEATMVKRREQIHKLKQAKQEGKIAYFVLDKLIIKDKRSG
ncbi:Hypothetical predicted protein [Paramuricea clavata]|uniref:Uncharacterized protein n=1 Tax=Paramuricea clavata TaxID=317549 RepID=A0A6S7KC48_PARCT|nr:Hypothetical predicted protein [Paramuricea clavata]